MTGGPARPVLEHALELCRVHHTALREALDDLRRDEWERFDLTALDKAQRRLLDQFAYRYTRLQDDMGRRLIPALLEALGEDVAEMPAIDRFARLEQLDWLPSAEEWAELRIIRNEFTHDYPESPAARRERLRVAMEAAERAGEIFDTFRLKIRQRWPNL